MARLSSRADLLDRLTNLSALDPDDMIGPAIAFPEQCQQAWESGCGFRLASRTTPKVLAVTGMGGSGVGGLLLAKLYDGRCSVPIVANRDYTVPASVGRDALLFAVSYSGDTEETLAATKQALDAGARVICLTTGGKLAKLAARYPRRTQVLTVPAGFSPRAALGHLFFPMLALTAQLGLLGRGGIAAVEREVTETLRLLRRMSQELHLDVPVARNEAKQLAHFLHGCFPIVYGGTGLMGVAAYRWRTQLNENSNTIASHHEFSELDHNEIQGWRGGNPGLPRPALIVLRSKGESKRMAERIKITLDILGRRLHRREVEARGASPLAQVLSAVYVGDFASIYLAYLNRVDPTEIDNIRQLKKALG